MFIKFQARLNLINKRKKMQISQKGHSDLFYDQFKNCYGTFTSPLMDSSKSDINREPSTLVVGMDGQPGVETG